VNAKLGKPIPGAGKIPLLMMQGFRNILSTIKSFFMAKYSEKAQDKVEKAMHERKHGTLKSGSGKKVTSRKQAIAIGLSEARAAGAKVPKKKASKR
jgi:hypothetical protein